jgi:hypothetical protein
VEPRPVAPQPNPKPQRETPATSPTTTLGDLADRLEEALAREVQSASQKNPLGHEPDAAGVHHAKSGAVGTELPSPEQRSAAEPKRDVVKTIPAAPDPEIRRDSRAQVERKDEAPVISLSARRREPVDPLEDEMARLLGELTGEANRR